jgi:hypothetical protein
MNNLIHFAFNVTLAKLYANMFVATLNQRLRARSRHNPSGFDFDSDNGGGKRSKRFAPIQFATNSAAGMNVHITTTKEMATDTPTLMTPVDHLNAFRAARNEAYAADDHIDLKSESNDGRSDCDKQKGSSV